MTSPPLDLSIFKDEESQIPVPEAFRPLIRDIVRALAAGNYELAGGVTNADVTIRDAKQAREYVADYGETLVELPDAAWSTSVCRWMRTHWDVLVDLWTSESGGSDLVLHLRVHETDRGLRFVATSLHVP